MISAQVPHHGVSSVDPYNSLAWTPVQVRQRPLLGPLRIGKGSMVLHDISDILSMNVEGALKSSQTSERKSVSSRYVQCTLFYGSLGTRIANPELSFPSVKFNCIDCGYLL
jgi:hypothetical protein